MRKPPAKRSAVRPCASCHRNQPIRWRYRLSTAFRRRLVADRVRLANQIRALLSEHGIVINRDIAQLRRGLAVIVGNINDGLSEMLRALMGELQEELSELDTRVAAYDRRITEIFRTNEQCQRLGKIEGIGPMTATALIAAVGDRSCFKNGRQFAAWLGLVPKQRSSGGRARLFGISKRGDRYLRTPMIHGARAALSRATGKQDPRSLWLGIIRQRRHPNVAAVALANKTCGSCGPCSQATQLMSRRCR